MSYLPYVQSGKKHFDIRGQMWPGVICLTASFVLNVWIWHTLMLISRDSLSLWNLLLLVIFFFFFFLDTRSSTYQASYARRYLTWTGRVGRNIWWFSRPKTWEGTWADYRGPQQSPWNWLMSTTTPLTSEGVSAASITSHYCCFQSLQLLRVI